MTDCLFCKIGEGSVTSDTVFENEKFRVFKDIHPKAPVHLLAIPKEHVDSVMSLGPAHSEMVAGLIYTAKKIASDMGLGGYKLVFNVGREGGQIIDHLHLHLLGGWGEGAPDNDAPSRL